MLRDLILKNRSYRRFHQDTAIEEDILRELVDLARLSATGSNRQPLRFYLSYDPETNAKIFPNISIAGNPDDDDKPTAYIIILGDTRVREDFICDHGIAAQSILLGATEKGLGGCMIGLINRKKLSEALDLPDHYQIMLALAMGRPKETPVLETVGQDGETAGWWDDQGVRHVPKHTLDTLIIN